MTGRYLTAFNRLLGNKVNRRPSTSFKFQRKRQNFGTLFRDAPSGRPGTNSGRYEREATDTLQHATDGKRLRRAGSRRIGAAGCAIGRGRGLACEFVGDSAHDAFGHRMSGRQHGQVDLQERAEFVVLALQLRECLGRGLRELGQHRLDGAGGCII